MDCYLNMCVRKCIYQLVLLLLTVPDFTTAGPVSSPETLNKSAKSNGNLSIQQQKFNNNNNNQDAQLNTLNAYAANYEVISNKQNQNDNFKPSYKLPEMETNFTPIYNGNSIAPELGSLLGTPTPVLMQYLPQTINEGGVQYLQLTPIRPLMVPIGPYLTGNTAVQSVTYHHQHLAPSNSIDYASRPLLSPLSVNMPPPAPSTLVDVQASSHPNYGFQSYAGNISPYKPNHRINRETKDKLLLGPISLNLNEYIPPSNSQQHNTFNARGRP